MPVSVRCFKCQTVHSFQERMSFREECTKCLNDLHVCRNCRHYDVGAHHECRESSADWVRDKEKSNRCEYFEPATGEGQADKKQDLLKAAEALFKKS